MGGVAPFADNAKEGFPVKRTAHKISAVAEINLIPLKDISETCINRLKEIN